uniref:Uncharacterized protein n=1 Tax=Spongospora subterranea TaxID=70186 RepID=A0A0H5R8G1_9EUKA|eukprot:CRZ04629.1 hypothetical protein [Spongospora subterranea]
MSASGSRRSSLRRPSRSSSNEFTFDPLPDPDSVISSNGDGRKEDRDRLKASLHGTVASLNVLKAKQEDRARRNQSMMFTSPISADTDTFSNGAKIAKSRSLSMSLISQTKAALHSQQQPLSNVYESDENGASVDISPGDQPSSPVQSRFKSLAAAVVAQSDHSKSSSLPNLANLVLARKKAALPLSDLSPSPPLSRNSFSTLQPIASESETSSLSVSPSPPSMPRKPSSFDVTFNPISSMSEGNYPNLQADLPQYDNEAARYLAEAEMVRARSERLDSLESRSQNRENQLRTAEAALQNRAEEISRAEMELAVKAKMFEDKFATADKVLAKNQLIEDLRHELLRKEEKLEMEKLQLVKAQEELAKKEHERQTSKEEIEQAEAEIDRRRKLMKVEADNLAQRTVEMTATRKSILSRDADLNAGERRLALIEQRVVERELQVQEREELNNRLKSELERDRLQLQSESKSLAVEKGHVQADLKVTLDSRAQVQSLSQEMESQVASLQHREMELSEKESEVETLLLRLKGREADLNNLGKRLELERIECDKRKQEVAEREQEMNARERAILENEKRLQEGQSQFTLQTEKRQTQLDSQIDDLNQRSAQIMAREQAIVGAEAERVTAAQEIAASKADIEAMVRRLEEEKRLFDQARIVCEQELESGRQQYETLRQEFVRASDEWRTKKETDEERIRTEFRRLDDSMSDVSIRESKCTKREQEIAEKDREVQSRLQAVSDLDAKRTDLTVMIAAVRERKDRLILIDEDMAVKREALSAQIESVRRDRLAIDDRIEQISRREELVKTAEQSALVARTEIERAKKDLTEKSRELTLDRKQLERERLSIESHLVALGKAEAEISEQQIQNKKETQIAREAAEQVQADRDRLMQDYDRFVSQRDEWRKEVQKSENEVASSFEQIDNDLQLLKQREISLGKKQALVQDQARKGLAHLEQRGATLDKLESELNQREADAAKRADDFRMRLSQLDQAQDSLRQRAAQLTSDEEDLNRRKSVLDDEAMQLETRMTRIDEHEKRLQADTKAQLDLLGQRLEDCRQQRAALDSDRVRSEERINAEQMRLTSAQERVAEDGRQLKQDVAALNRMQATLADDRRQLERQMKNCDSREAELSQLQTRLNRQERDLERRVIDLNLTLKQAASQLQNSRAEQAEIEASNKAMRESLHDGRLQCESFSKESSELSAKIADSRAQIQELESRRRQIEHVLEKVSRECAEVRASASQAEVDRVQALNQVSHEKAVLQQLQYSIDAKELKLKEREAELNERESHLRETEEREFAAVQAKMKDLQRSFQNRDVAFADSIRPAPRLFDNRERPGSAFRSYPTNPFAIDGRTPGQNDTPIRQEPGFALQSLERQPLSLKAADDIQSKPSLRFPSPGTHISSLIREYSALTGLSLSDSVSVLHDIRDRALWTAERPPELLKRVSRVMQSLHGQCPAEAMSQLLSRMDDLQHQFDQLAAVNERLCQRMSQHHDDPSDIIASACHQISSQLSWSQSIQDHVIAPLSVLQERVHRDLDDAASCVSSAPVDEFEVFRQQVRSDPSFATYDGRSPSSAKRNVDR